MELLEHQEDEHPLEVAVRPDGVVLLLGVGPQVAVRSWAAQARWRGRVLPQPWRVKQAGPQAEGKQGLFSVTQEPS